MRTYEPHTNAVGIPDETHLEGHGATILLIRHARTAAIGRWLCGRSAGIRLSDAGRLQADRLGQSLESAPISAIYTSPLERAIDTAEAVARYQRIPVQVCDDLTEFDFGD